MTHTLPKRTNRVCHSPPHAHGGEGRGPHRAGHPDAADIAGNLRALALHAHRLMQDTREAASPFDRTELRDVRTSLADLEADCLDQQLHGLVPYLKALRQKVEDRLG